MASWSGPRHPVHVEIVDVPHMVGVDSVVREGDVLRLTGSLDGDLDEFDLVLAAARAEIPVAVDR